MTKPVQIHPVGMQARFVKILVYGIPGIGKTRLLGTSPKCLVLECGKGETDTCAAAGQNVDVWEVSTLAQLTDAYEYLRHEGINEYEWVWIDGLSPLEGRLMKEQLQLVKARNPNRSDLIPDKAEYQNVQNNIDRFVSWFVDLPMNTGFTAHVMLQNITQFDEDGDEQEVLQMMPQIQGGPGKLSQKICGYMNVVGYLDTISAGENNNVRAMLVRGDGRHIAKDRFDVLGNKQGWMLNPTVPKMMSAVKDKLATPQKAKPTKKGATKVTKKATKTAVKKTTSLRAR